MDGRNPQQTSVLATVEQTLAGDPTVGSAILRRSKSMICLSRLVFCTDAVQKGPPRAHTSRPAAEANRLRFDW